MWSAKENALRQRVATQIESLEANSHELKPLAVGDPVRVQNQHGPHPNKWDRTGVIMQVGEHDQYIVRMDGSRRLSLRNRKYLRKIKPYDTRLFGAGSPPVSHNPVHTTVFNKEVMDSHKPTEEAPQSSHPTNTFKNVHSPETCFGLPDVSPDLPTEFPLPALSEPAVKENSLLQPVQKRGPGRPPKRRNYNFTPRSSLDNNKDETSALGSPPPAFTDGKSAPDPPSNVSESPLDVGPRRSQRERREPERFQSS